MLGVLGFTGLKEVSLAGGGGVMTGFWAFGFRPVLSDRGFKDLSILKPNSSGY